MDQNPKEPKPDEQNSIQSSGAANGDSSQDDEEFFNSIPPGNRFVPTDEELVVEYLMKKVNNETLPRNRIPEVNLYSKDPNQLTVEYKPITETEWYFYTPRDKKYPNGSRPNRSTPKGYWKPTGTDKAIPSGSGHSLGYKKTLDFYQGKHPGGTKTDWKMHEYVLKDSNINNSKSNDKKRKVDMTLDDWVLCRIYKKKKENNGGDEPGDGGTQAPTVEIAQNNEASLMVGNNNKFEDQNWNASQPTHSVSQNNEASLMFGNNNEFEDQNWNASPLTVTVSQNNGASLMAGNSNNAFENQNSNAYQSTVL